MLTRAQIIANLTPHLAQSPVIHAAWLGGSDAFDRADELSDLDVCCVVEPGAVEQAAAHFDVALRALSPVRVHFRMPMPTWHGFHQAFYQLENAPESAMIDWVFVERDQPHPWLQVERHGTPKVLFDKIGAIRSSHVDQGAIDSAVARKVEDLRVKFALFKHLPIKLVERGQPIDAAAFYQSLVLRQLVDLLRCVHCPHRHDYGLRYLRHDLPSEACDAVERLSYFATPAQLLEHVASAEKLFAKTLLAWDARTNRPR